MGLVVKLDELFDPLEIRFLTLVGVILQTQSIVNVVKLSNFYWKYVSPPG